MYIHLQDQKFPFISDLDVFKSCVGDKPEIRFTEQSNGTVVGCYMISTPDLFDNEYAKECRGIVFNAEGRVISRSLHKFFNVNEKPFTQADVIDWSKVSRVMTKRDGSMIAAVAVPSDQKAYSLKSKKSYDSDVAVQARGWIAENPDREVIYDNFNTWIVENHLTAIFEWTSPKARIVVGYQEPSLTLLHVRENDTGTYFTKLQLWTLSLKWEIPLVDDHPEIEKFLKDPEFDPRSFLENSQATEGIEGWVIQFENGDMVKLKTKWYSDRHAVMTFPRVRDIARQCLNETIDDMKSMLVSEGIDITEILEIEAKVAHEVTKIAEDVDAMYKKWKHEDKKTVALALHPTMGSTPYQHFKLLMDAYVGKEPDFKGYFEKNFLSDMFDLTQLNLMNTVAEID